MRKHLFQGLMHPPLTEPLVPSDDTELVALTEMLDQAAQRRLGHSLSVREVDAGSCNGCELEINALSNAFYDLERFGLRFVASPRHADVLLVTGPITRNMRDPLKETYEAMPHPKWVVAAGDCAVNGGCFGGSYAVVGAASHVVPVDVVLHGCPPSPTQLLRGLILLMSQPIRSTSDHLSGS